MRKITVAAAAMGAMLALPAMAQMSAPASTAPAAPTASTPVTEVKTVADLAAVCDPPGNGLRLESIAYCQGFLNAAGQYHSALYPTGGPVQGIFCAPTPAPTVAQAGIAFSTWAKQNTQYSSDPALDGLMRWAQATYPCPPMAATAAKPTPRHRTGSR